MILAGIGIPALSASADLPPEAGRSAERQRPAGVGTPALQNPMIRGVRRATADDGYPTGYSGFGSGLAADGGPPR